MSEPTQPPRETPPAAPKAKGRPGGLPWWAWAGIAVAVVAGVIIWRKNSASNASASQSGVGAPETAIPVPVGTGLTGSQYAALASQNAAIYEAILDMQGDKSKDKAEDKRADEAAQDRRQEAEQDADQKSAKGTSGPVTPGPGGVASGTGKGGGGDTGPPLRKPKRGTHYLPDGRVVPNSVG